MNCKIELAHERDPACLKLSGRLDFDSVCSLEEEASRYIGQYRSLEIDLSGITYVNSAGLALLLDWTGNATKLGHELRFHNVPQKLHDIARLSELENILFPAS